MTNPQTEVEARTSFRWLDADAYLFDIDGTLLVARGLVHYHALNRAMRDVYGVETTIDGIAYHGKTDLGILRAALERAGVSGDIFESKLAMALDLVCSDVAANRVRMTTDVCSGIANVLAHLKSAGKLVGVASGNLETVGWQKIGIAGLQDFFSFGCFADHHENRADIFRTAVEEVKRRLGPGATVCFIGDTPEDIKAARQVNANIIAVCTGIYKAEELGSLEPDLCVGSCEELLTAR
jgi:phosphoglycolate phosphatase